MPARSDLDFETNFHDLSSRDAEIGGRKIRVEVHCSEDPLAPDRHPGHFAVGDDYDPARVKGDPVEVDAAQSGVAAGEFEPLDMRVPRTPRLRC